MPHPLLVPVQLSLVALAVGLILLKSPALLRVSAFSRILYGAALTPFLLGSFTLLVSLLWPGTDRWIYLLPLMVAITVIIREREGIVWIVEKCLKWQSDLTARPLRLVLCFATLVSFAWILSTLVTNSLHPVTGHDALIYFNEAKTFVAERSLQAVPDFQASVPDVVSTHPHTFLYQAFIANSFVLGSVDIGSIDDLAARIASQSMVIFLLLGVLALCGSSRKPAVATMGLLFTLSVSTFGYLSQHDSRDGFRILSIVLLALALMPLAVKRSTSNKAAYLLPAVSAACAIYAHTLNILFVAIMGFAYLVAGLANRTPILTLSKTLLAVVGGAGIAGLHYVDSWLQTGSVLGSGMYYKFYIGTPLWEAFATEGSWGAPDRGAVGTIAEFGHRYGNLLTWGGFVSAIFLVCRRESGQSRLPAAFLILGLMVPLTGILESNGISLRQALVANIRYPLVVYPFAALSLSSVVCIVAYRLYTLDHRLADSMRLVLCLLVLLATSNAVTSIRSWERRTWAPDYVESNYLQLEKVLEEAMEPGENWVTDLYAAAYYSPRQPIFLFSESGSVLFHTTDEKKIRALLESSNVRVVALRNDLEIWWGETVFLKVVQEMSVEEEKFGFWNIFVLGRPIESSAAERQPNEFVH